MPIERERYVSRVESLKELLKREKVLSRVADYFGEELASDSELVARSESATNRFSDGA